MALAATSSNHQAYQLSKYVCLPNKVIMTIVMVWRPGLGAGRYERMVMTTRPEMVARSRVGLIEYWLCLGPCSLVELADEQS